MKSWASHGIGPANPSVTYGAVQPVGGQMVNVRFGVCTHTPEEGGEPAALPG